MKNRRPFDLIVESGVLISLTGMIFSIVIQVFTRFFMESAPSWTEEAARMFFIFAVAFGAGLAIRDNQYVQLDYFLNRIPIRTKNRIQLIINGIVLFFGILISFYAVKFIQIGSTETSPSLQIRMSYIFSSMLIMGILLTFYSAKKILIKIKKA
jgi:TRAP-type C4-dicarboxylate transport system permease small subunit